MHYLAALLTTYYAMCLELCVAFCLARWAWRRIGSPFWRPSMRSKPPVG